MTRSRLIMTWLLLLIPTLLLGSAALYLLKAEEARLASSARAAAADRVAAIAGNIDLAIGEVKEGLLETLQTLPADNLLGQTDRLEEWKRGNPLVRNVFVWEQGRGLRYPDPEQPSSDEEAAFIRRYLSLFANQAGWQEPTRDEPAAAAADQVSSILQERRDLRQLAKSAPVAAESAAAPAAPAASAALPGSSGAAPRPQPAA